MTDPVLISFLFCCVYVLTDQPGTGSLVQAVIPRPHPSGDPVPGVGKVFLEYADVESSARAKTGMHGRRFDGKETVAVFFPENKLADRDYDA